MNQARAACVYEYQQAVHRATESRDAAALDRLEYELHSGEIDRRCGRARR